MIDKRNIQYIGKLNTEYIGEYANKIYTKDVILTNERKLHIFQNHSNDFDLIINNISNAILFPYMVMEDTKNEDTLFFVGKIGEENLNVIIKLCTENDFKHPKNSIMSAWIIRETN